jgi:hypothetical protein
VPIIVGSDITTQQFKFHYALMDQRHHSYLYYFIEENVLEGKVDDIPIPAFNGKMDKIQKRFKRLKQFFTTTNFQLKNKEAYLNNFLIKFREMLDGTIVDATSSLPMIPPPSLKSSSRGVRVTNSSWRSLAKARHSQSFLRI